MPARLALWSVVVLTACDGGAVAQHDAAPLDSAWVDASSFRTCDRDEDGFIDVLCGGDDCDDATAARHPGAEEVCDELDQDCVLTTFGFRDDDADGYVDAFCYQSQYGSMVGARGTDCDDHDAGTHPDALELCDGIDQDCDRHVDEDAMHTYYQDVDGDGFAGSRAFLGCSGTFTTTTDCDDGDPLVHPGVVDAAPQTCNGVDDDCNGVVDDGCACTAPATETCGPLDPADPSGATFLTRGACRTSMQSCSGSQWEPCIGAVFPQQEECTAGAAPAADEDCDGQVDEGDRFGLCTCATATGSLEPTTVTVLAGAPTSALGIELTLVEGIAASATAPASATIDLACPSTTQSLGTMHLDTSTPVWNETIAPDVCVVEVTLVEADASHAVVMFQFVICG